MAGGLRRQDRRHPDCAELGLFRWQPRFDWRRAHGHCDSLWIHLSLLDQCRECVERAVASDMAEPRHSDRNEMKLYAPFYAGLLYARGPLPMAGVALTRALQ